MDRNFGANRVDMNNAFNKNKPVKDGDKSDAMRDTLSRYTHSKAISAAMQFGAKQAVTKALKVAMGSNPFGVILSMLIPSEVGTNYDYYCKTGLKLEKLLTATQLDELAIRKELDNLESAKQGIFVERDLGRNEDAYRNLDVLTARIKSDTESLLKEKKN